MAPGQDDQLLDDHRVIGGSPTDRIIGMLLERLEAVRELHDQIRDRDQKRVESDTALQVQVARLVDKIDNHERSDMSAFAAVHASSATLGLKLDELRNAIQSATTAGLIQRIQISTGWKVIAVIGATSLAIFTIFFGFFNHKW